MAIEIIPKPKIKKVSWLRIVLSVILALWIVFLLSYFILIFYQVKLNRELSELERKLVKTPLEEDLERNLFFTKRQIEDWKLIATSHPRALRAFEFLEKNSHPKVWFSDFKLDLGQTAISLEGRADSFKTLSQQILIFEKQELVKKTTLSKISLGREGEIVFKIRLDLDAKIFQ